MAISFLFMGCPENDFEELRLDIIYGEFGSNPGQFDTPMGLTVRYVGGSLRNCLFIADYNNNRIQIISPRLFENVPDTIIVIENPSSDTMGPIWPTSVTVTQSIMDDASSVSDNPLIYVTDSRNDRIMVYNLDGELQRSWGSYGSGERQFKTPLSIDMDFEGNIFVVDSGNNRIQVFDTAGNFIRMWGEKGTEPGRFDSPIDIEVCFTDTYSNVFKYVAVSDWGNDRVQLFDRLGNSVGSISGIPRPTGLSHSGSSAFHVISSTTGRGYVTDENRVYRSYIIPGSVKPYGIWLFHNSPTISDMGSHRVAYYLEGATQ